MLNKQHPPSGVHPYPGGHSVPLVHRIFALPPLGQSGMGSGQQPRPVNQCFYFSFFRLFSFSQKLLVPAHVSQYS